MGQYTGDEMHTAMCLWEAWLDLEQETEATGSTDLARRMLAIREAQGTCSLRLLILDLVKDCDLAWEAYVAMNGDGIAFDWEFVPEFLTGQVMSGRLDAAAENQWQVAS